MTAEEKFLAWCKANNIKPVLKEREGSGDWKEYHLNEDRTATLVIQGHAFDLNSRTSDFFVGFSKKDGHWMGGTNLLWCGLPWEKR